MESILNTLFGNQWVVFVTITILLLGAAEVGHRLGLRLHVSKDEARREQISGVQGALLGLLGLLLAFTFSMGVSRYERRQELVLLESNAIGTAYLRAGMLPNAQSAAVRDRLRLYVDTKIKYERIVREPGMLEEGQRQLAVLEQEVWRHAEAAAADAPTPVTAAFITAANEMLDTAAARIAAGRNSIPAGVWLLVALVAACGTFTSAYGSGACGVRSAFTSILLPVVITVAIVLIFDLTHSRQGFISINQQPMLDLQASLQR